MFGRRILASISTLYPGTAVEKKTIPLQHAGVLESSPLQHLRARLICTITIQARVGYFHFSTSMPPSHVYKPPNSDGYFEDASDNTHRPSTPSTSGISPWARLNDGIDNVEQIPFPSPDAFAQSPPGPLQSQKSFAGTTRSRQSLPSNIEIQSLIQHRSGMTSTWGIHWWTPFCLISLFVLGVLGACVHHGFYLSLDGKEVKDQLWMVRVGTGMAFFVKMCLVGTVVLAYKQRIWYSMRRKSMTVGAIDGLL